MFNPTNKERYIFTPQSAKKIRSRIEDMHLKLYAHSYAFYMNYVHGEFDIFDLCSFASLHNLAGICTQIHPGKTTRNYKKSFLSLSNEQIDRLKFNLHDAKLNINLEISSTSLDTVNEAVQVAKKIGIKTIRVYIRYEGRLLDIINRGIEDLKKIADIAERNDLNFVLEPHEVLKAAEFVLIMEAVNSPRVGLLFDFGNMVNAGDRPLDAFKIMSPYIRHVHIKDVKIERDRTGYKHIGVEQGSGDIPAMHLLTELMLLGEDSSQVLTYGLEQEVGYVSPAFRFENEDPNPLIPYRSTSATEIGSNVLLQDTLLTERNLATQQVNYVRGMLEEIDAQACAYLDKA